MIKTKSVYHDRPEESDGIRILVMRRWCRPLSKEKAKIDEWLKDLGPSEKLLTDFQNSLIIWDDYQKRFQEEMKPKTALLKTIAEKSKNQNVTLLCCEKDDKECHRRLLKEIIENIDS